jgi:hypothetical protein
MLTDIHDAPAEGNLSTTNRKAKSRKLWQIIPVTSAMWIRETEWPTATPFAVKQ